MAVTLTLAVTAAVVAAEMATMLEAASGEVVAVVEPMLVEAVMAEMAMAPAMVAAAALAAAVATGLEKTASVNNILL